MGGLVTNRSLYKRLPFDPDTDFAPISMLATAGQVLVAHTAVPLHSPPERVTELVKSGSERMAKVVKAAGIQPE